MTADLHDGGNVAVPQKGGGHDNMYVIDTITRAGDYLAAIKILNNDPENRQLTVPITFHVIGPKLTLSDQEVFYGRSKAVSLTLDTKGLALSAATFGQTSRRNHRSPSLFGGQSSLAKKRSFRPLSFGEGSGG